MSLDPKNPVIRYSPDTLLEGCMLIHSAIHMATRMEANGDVEAATKLVEESSQLWHAIQCKLAIDYFNTIDVDITNTPHTTTIQDLHSLTRKYLTHLLSMLPPEEPTCPNKTNLTQTDTTTAEQDSYHPEDPNR